MRIVTIALLAASFAAVAAPKPQTRIPIKEGMTYEVARGIIINHGWSPISANDGKDCGMGASPGVCKTFPEIDNCMGTGVGVCKMFFKDPWDRMLVVQTTGGMDVSGKLATIYSWSIKR